MRFLRWLLAFFFGIRPAVRWEDGVVTTDLRYRFLYADTVDWVRSVRPEAVQAGAFRVTVRLYERWPVSDGLTHYGKVLSPNVIAGDSSGTLCLYKGKKHPLDENIVHEMKHAITGESGHLAWLFPEYTP